MSGFLFVTDNPPSVLYSMGMKSAYLAETEKSLETLSDEAVLELSQRKPDAFAEIVKRYEAAFMRKAMSVLRNEEDSADVVQETFVKMYSAGGRFVSVPGAKMSSWGYKILMNTCLSLLRKQKVRRADSLDADPELPDAVADEGSLLPFERIVSRDYAFALISRLPDLLQSTAKKHFIDGLPYEDMAAAEGVSEGVIRTRIHRARGIMKKIVDTNF